MIYIYIYTIYTLNIQQYVTMFNGFYKKKTTMFCQPTSHRPTIPSRADLQCHHAMPLAAQTVVFVFCAEGGKKLLYIVSHVDKSLVDNL